MRSIAQRMHDVIGHISHMDMRGDFHPLRAQFERQIVHGGNGQIEARELGRIGEDLCRRALERNAALVEHHHAVGLRRLLHIVRDHNDRHACTVELAAHAHQTRTPARVEHRRRLVEHEHRRMHGERAGDGDALLLPARKRMGLVLLKAGQADLGKRVAHALRELGVAHPQILGAEGDICLDKRCHELVVGVLKHHAHR